MNWIGKLGQKPKRKKSRCCHWNEQSEIKLSSFRIGRLSYASFRCCYYDGKYSIVVHNSCESNIYCSLFIVGGIIIGKHIYAQWVEYAFILVWIAISKRYTKTHINLSFAPLSYCCRWPKSRIYSAREVFGQLSQKFHILRAKTANPPFDRYNLAKWNNSHVMWLSFAS